MGGIRSVVIAAGGVAAVFGLYWDDAWHTDVGRDTFFAPPHLLLYAGVSVLLTVMLLSAWQRYRTEGWVMLRDMALVLPLGGAGVTLAAAPVDELWHQLFGRDAVVWSPPHMVAVAGLLAFAAGLLLAVHRARRHSRLVGAVVGAFLIAAAATVVMEFEADVPQFPVVLYLPVAVGALTFVFGLIRRVARGPWAVTEAAGVYVLLRIGVLGFLAALGHSLPTAMPTVVAAWAFDLSVRHSGRRTVVALVTAVATVSSHGAAHVLQPAGLAFTTAEVLIGVVGGAALAWGALAATGLGRVRTPLRGARVATAAVLVLVFAGMAGPAFAHDPGQGEEVAPVTLDSRRAGDEITLHVTADRGSCAGWEPVAVLARRAGRVEAAALEVNGDCWFQGTLTVDDPGRWFVYAEFDVGGQRTETWLPVDVPRHSKNTVLYVAPNGEAHLVQVVAGVLLYLLVALILAGVVVTYRRAGSAGPRNV
jgi:hypothetical protein